MDPKQDKVETTKPNKATKSDEKDQQQASVSPSAPDLHRSLLQDDDVLRRPGSALDQEDQFTQLSSSVAMLTAPSALQTSIGGRPLMFGSGFSMGPPSLSMGKKVNAKKPERAVMNTSRVDRTNYMGVVPRALPPPPFRLEMHTHFHVKNEAIQRVCSVVGMKLCELDTDFEFSADKCKWKVEFRRANSIERVQVNIVIFKSGNEFVVEAQRREGDITALMVLYNELKSFFKRNQMLVEKDASVAGVKRPAPEALMAPLPKVSRTSVQSAVSSIRGLLESKFVDVQMQGALAAISLSAKEDSKADMSMLVPLLVMRGQSINDDVSKLVRVALARLCNHSTCRQALVESEGWQFIVKCAAGGDGVKPEVQRDSLRVVECLCSLYSDELAKVEGADKVLTLIQDWEDIQDPRLKKHACNAHRALKEAGVIA